MRERVNSRSPLNHSMTSMGNVTSVMSLKKHTRTRAEADDIFSYSRPCIKVYNWHSRIIYVRVCVNIACVYVLCKRMCKCVCKGKCVVQVYVRLCE